MVSNITYDQAEVLVDRLEDVEGIKQVEFDRFLRPFHRNGGTV